MNHNCTCANCAAYMNWIIHGSLAADNNGGTSDKMYNNNTHRYGSITKTSVNQ